MDLTGAAALVTGAGSGLGAATAEALAAAGARVVALDLNPEGLAALRRDGIGFGTVYPGAMSEQPGAAGHLAAHVGGTTAAWLGRSVLNLPLFAHVRDDELQAVLAAMRRATLDAGFRSGPAGSFSSEQA